jgi:hypothetical protein
MPLILCLPGNNSSSLCPYSPTEVLILPSSWKYLLLVRSSASVGFTTCAKRLILGNNSLGVTSCATLGCCFLDASSDLRVRWRRRCCCNLLSWDWTLFRSSRSFSVWTSNLPLFSWVKNLCKGLPKLKSTPVKILRKVITFSPLSLFGNVGKYF